MSETHRPRRIGRSIGAVLTGFLAVIILSLGTDIVLHAIGVFPRLGQPMAGTLFLLAAAYRTVYGAAGSYITARPEPGLGNMRLADSIRADADSPAESPSVAAVREEPPRIKSARPTGL